MLRPEQFAWAKRRVNMGGIVVCLHRNNGLPWFLHDLRWVRTHTTSKHVIIDSDPHHSAYTVDMLDAALTALCKKTTNS